MRSKLSILAYPLAIGTLGAACLGDHIPGHSNSDPIFPIPIPGQDVFSGGALAVSAFGPVGGTEITGATFDITFVTDGAATASDIMFLVRYDTPDFETIQTTVTGADLGFGSGAGTFSGTFSTAALNGVVRESFFLPPNSLIEIQIGAVGGGGIDGFAYFENSFIYLDVVPAPASATLLMGAGAACARRRR